MGPTIRDVARAAGVSTATVSHTLNSTGRIGKGTRKRVMAVARRLKYYPNGHARALAARTNMTLGLVVSDIENPFFAQVFKNFEARARELGYEVILSSTGYNVQQMKRTAERMLEEKVRGVAIMTSEMTSSLVEEIIERGIAVTYFDLDFHSQGASSLKVDYLSGMRQVVDHLHQLGHKRIAYVGGQPALKNILSRHDAYLASMKALGLEPGPVLIGNQRFDGGYTAGQSILKMSPRPTAAVAVNDLTAAGLISALTQGGLRVPEDISVTGFDNTYLAAYFVPRLTTVDMHPDLLGRLAADALHQESSNPKQAGRDYLIHADLVIGQSTAPPPD
jgi:LacI family transcriptional regulator